MTLNRPELTMPEAEATRLLAAYERAQVILEYGSGGSTVMAAGLADKTVFAVESDAAWAAMMDAWFAANPPASGSRVLVHHCDIGPTKAWGHPKDRGGHLRYAAYPLGIWDLAGFRQPDVVLVDGRFRPGCALATAFRTARPVTLFIDDYAPRRQYHAVEAWLGPPRMTGRMAEFTVTPQPVPADRLIEITTMMTRP